MNKLLKTTALCLAAATLFTTTAFAGSSLLPVRSTFEEAGYSISWIQETQEVVIEKDGFKMVEGVGANITLNENRTYASEEFVNSVHAIFAKEAFSTKATVIEVGEGFILADSEKLGEVIFTVDNNTSFHHEMNRRLYTLADVEVGTALKVYFSEAMTASLPPQTYATEVVFLNEAAEEVKLSATGKVTEVGEDYVLVETETLGEVVFTVGSETNIHHEMNRMFYALGDITKDMIVTVYYGDVMTASLPPQTAAFEIVIMNTEEATIEALTTEATVIEVGEGYFLAEKADGSRVRFNTDEQTNFHHVMNRMLYRLESLEEGMKLEVKHADAATFSLPPQMYAIEVIIK